MVHRIKNILRGVGSIVDINPATNYADFIPRQSQKDRLAGHFIQVGEQLRKGIETYSNEQKKQG